MSSQPKIMAVAFGISLSVHAALLGALVLTSPFRTGAPPEWELPEGDAEGVQVYFLPLQVEELPTDANDSPEIEEPEPVAIAQAEPEPIDEQSAEVETVIAPPIALQPHDTHLLRSFASSAALLDQWLHTRTQVTAAEKEIVQNPSPPQPAMSISIADLDQPTEIIAEPIDEPQGATPGINEGPVPDARNKPPKYPTASRRRSETGTVLLRCTIDAGGNVSQIALAQSSGFDALDRAALDAVKNWRFAPATEDGVAVSCNIQLPIVFVLK